jgi:putative RecB family exonuclease
VQACRAYSAKPPRLLTDSDPPTPPEGLPLRPYSHSKLSTFENCPRQFEFRYVKKIERDEESIEAFLGKRVHEILERLYHHVGRHGRPPSMRQVLDRFRKDWALRWHGKVGIVRTERGVDDYLEIGERCLGNYYRGHYPFDEDTVAIEEPISLDLDPSGTYRARGIVDRISRAGPGRYEIHDYKTGSWLPTQQRIDADRQLALYQIGLVQRYPDTEGVELVWHYLAFNRTLRSRREPEALERLKTETIELIDRIEATSEYPPKPGPLCRWCEYRELCPDAKLPEPQPEPPVPADADAPPSSGESAAVAPRAVEKAAVPGDDGDPLARAPVQLSLL